MGVLKELGIFFVALAGLIVAARIFTRSSENLGRRLHLPPFVIGIFIVGIGTSLPELIAGVVSVGRGFPEVMPGNVIGANVSNVLFITGLCVVLHRETLNLRSKYIFIDLHFLIGSFFFFAVIAWDGVIEFSESFMGIIIYLIYAFYLIRGEAELDQARPAGKKQPGWGFSLLFLLGASTGIYLSAEYTILSLTRISELVAVPHAIVSLTLLSLGTTLPELAVNMRLMMEKKAEMAIGNVLGSSVFNSLMIPSLSTLFGQATLPAELLNLPLPIMAGSGLLFYLLTHDKKMSIWEGLLFVCLYGVFIIKVLGF
ncbi:MAG: sodium:calcium antiporter [Flavobacteriales bacterium]|nr:sodium:calcium antiporter [Flavobacteriales bacterium]MDW8433056.1 sodium:calcium antiporter [Flavobacteriales bacterium]